MGVAGDAVKDIWRAEEGEGERDERKDSEGEESDEKRDGVETMVSECSRREGNFEGDDERRTEQGLTEI